MTRIAILALAAVLPGLAGATALAEPPPASAADPAAVGESSAATTLADLGWLVGHWRGEALGGVAEEVWAPAAGGALMGMFRLVKDGEVAFYELFTVAEPVLDLRLKHFHGDLTGWEEREEVVVFPFLRASGTEAWFEGLVYRLRDDGKLEAVVTTRDETGEHELTFVYERVEGEIDRPRPDPASGKPR